MSLDKEIVTGTVEGTGVILQCEIGFEPQYFKCFNIDDAGDLHPVFEWTKDMAAASAFKGLKIADNGSTANLSNTYVSSNGITSFAGEASGKILTGTVAVTAASGSITGTNTLATTELRVGDVIKIGGDDQTAVDGATEYTIATISSATAFTITPVAGATHTAGVMTRITPRLAGVKIGADADMNAAGETIAYIAVR